MSGGAWKPYKQDWKKVMIESSAASSQYSQITQTNPFFTPDFAGAVSRSTTNSPANAFQDKVTISPEAKSIKTRQAEKTPSDEDTSSSNKNRQNSVRLPPEEQREVTKLQRRDAEVRAHEQAHLSAAGQHAAGGMSFTYEVGPNGKRYATGGEVPIDLSRESTPEETIVKMQQVAKAALAPANPSAADRNIAARAHTIATEARREINDTASPEKIDDDSDDSAAEDIKNTMDITSSSPESMSPDTSNSSTFMPSRQMVLKAYARIS